MDYHRIGGVKLARITNIPLSTIKNIRLGKNVNPTIETLVPLARYFNCSLEEVIYGNFSVEKLAKDKSRVSRNFAQSVPVILWEEAVSWRQPHLQNDWRIFTEKQCSKQTFAVYLKQKISDIFTMPGIIYYQIF